MHSVLMDNRMDFKLSNPQLLSTLNSSLFQPRQAPISPIRQSYPTSSALSRSISSSVIPRTSQILPNNLNLWLWQGATICLAHTGWLATSTPWGKHSEAVWSLPGFNRVCLRWHAVAQSILIPFGKFLEGGIQFHCRRPNWIMGKQSLCLLWRDEIVSHLNIHEFRGKPEVTETNEANCEWL